MQMELSGKYGKVVRSALPPGRKSRLHFSIISKCVQSNFTLIDDAHSYILYGLYDTFAVLSDHFFDEWVRNRDGRHILLLSIICIL